MISRRGFTLVELVVVIVTILVLWYLLLPGKCCESREGIRIESCTENIERIVLALKDYVTKHGCLPPAAVLDDEDKPAHSWRVLILPFLDKQELYDAYDFQQPWNSPQNLELGPAIAEIYHCPSDPPMEIDSGFTNYFAVVGPGTIWDSQANIGMQELKEAPQNLILVAECAARDVHVLDPSDLPKSELELGVNRVEGKGISSMHPSLALVGLADGKC